MPDVLRPFAVLPGEGPRMEGPAGGPLTSEARGEQTGGSLTVLENVIAPGDGPPPAGMERFFDAWAASAPGPQAVVAAGERAGIRVVGPPLRGAGTAG